jgi:DNA replication protein DnaC
MTTTAKQIKPVAPPSVPQLDAGLRRLKLAAIRRTAPEVLLTAKTQRWTPEEVLRTLVETELAARDASNIVNRLKAAAFPVPKTLESFDVAASSIQLKVFDYLSSLEWIRAQQNLAIIGPAGTGKSHTLIGLGTLIRDQEGRVVHAPCPVDLLGIQNRIAVGAVVTRRRGLSG